MLACSSALIRTAVSFCSASKYTVAPPKATFSDPFVLQLAETLEDSLPPSLPLADLRHHSSLSLLSTAWPSRKQEPFRFTDTSFLRHRTILPVPSPPKLPPNLDGNPTSLSLVIADGFVLPRISNFQNSCNGVSIGTLFGDLGFQTPNVKDFLMHDFEHGDVFWFLNGLGAVDIAVLHIFAGVKLDVPVHIQYVAVSKGEEGGDLPISNPRVVVVVENGAELEVVEEFVRRDGHEDETHWTNSVLQVMIREGGVFKHSYIQNQSLNSAHIKWTLVHQEKGSRYKLVEVSSGGKLSRHNLHIKQLGPDTVTDLSTFHLVSGNQTQDLHSRLILDFPRGYARQLHKCIVGHPRGQAVFDGNMRVNRHAQQTDAGQLTRTLLLEPQATVNLKPNLQIIADDVKCSHGATVSDLDEAQLFYFKARGVSPGPARRALMRSFASEVIRRIPNSRIRDNINCCVDDLLLTRGSSQSERDT